MSASRRLGYLARRVVGSNVNPSPLAILPRLHSTRCATANAAPTPDTGAAGFKAVTPGLNKHAQVGNKRFADFDLAGKTFVVTGGARGLGLALAEALVEAGGKEQNDGIHGLVAAAGIQQIKPAADYTPEEANEILSTNYTAVLMSASITARVMFKYKCRGNICLIASMSGTIANKGLESPVYNSSKAAVIQLARNLAMEWSPVQEDGTGGIRVNCLSPGHIMTPIVLKNFEEVPGLHETWCRENMMGRLAEPSEFKGAALFMLSKASSFMTGRDVFVDGGHTAW